MKIAIHSTNQEHKDTFSTRWKENLEKRGIEVLEHDFRSQDIIGKLRGCDGAMWHWHHRPDDKQSAQKILSAVELCLNIPVFPNLKTRWHYDEKVAQHYLLESIDAPKIKSWVFWNHSDAITFLKKCKYPIVFKLSVGAGSSNVLKIDSFNEAQKKVDAIFKDSIIPYTFNEFSNKSILKDPKQFLRKAYYAARYVFLGKYPRINYYHIQKNYAYFQEFLPDNKYDIRITVIGNRTFGYVRHNRNNDFRASGSGKIDYDLKKIPLECVRIAQDISQKCNFQSMAYDFLIGEKGNPLVNEISYCYVNTLVNNCPGHWDRNLDWHKGNMWPEEAHVEDFVNLIKEKNNK